MFLYIFSGRHNKILRMLVCDFFDTDIPKHIVDFDSYVIPWMIYNPVGAKQYHSPRHCRYWARRYCWHDGFRRYHNVCIWCLSSNSILRHLFFYTLKRWNDLRLFLFYFNLFSKEILVDMGALEKIFWLLHNGNYVATTQLYLFVLFIFPVTALEYL